MEPLTRSLSLSLSESFRKKIFSILPICGFEQQQNHRKKNGMHFKDIQVASICSSSDSSSWWWNVFRVETPHVQCITALKYVMCSFNLMHFDLLNVKHIEFNLNNCFNMFNHFFRQCLSGKSICEPFGSRKPVQETRFKTEEIEVKQSKQRVYMGVRYGWQNFWKCSWKSSWNL